MSNSIVVSYDQLTGAEVDEATSFAQHEWGWAEPTHDVIETAAIQIKCNAKEYQTGQILLSLNVIGNERAEQLIELASNDTSSLKFFDKLHRLAIKTERDVLSNVRNKVIGYTLSIQTIQTLNGYVNIDDAMKNKEVAAYCKKINAIVCKIQDTQPVVVFAESEDELRSFSTLGGADKSSNPIYKYFANQPDFNGRIVCALAANEQLIHEANHLVDSGVSLEKQNNNIYHHSLKKEQQWRKLASIHEEALKKGATDIHILPEVNNPLIKVAFRINGVIRIAPDAFWLSKEEYLAASGLLSKKSGAEADGAKLLRTGDGRYTYISESNTVEVRTAFINKGTDAHQNSMISIRLRLIPQEHSSVKLGEIGVPDPVLSHMRQSMLADSGLVVMVGPTGAGKSTTLFGLVDLHCGIHGDTKSRVSFEEPIERYAEGIDQIQVRPLPSDDPGKNLFLEYLRSAVRFDPDFILLGEIRDGDSAYMAAEQAVTGHKAVSTLHASNTVEGLQRLINMMPTEDSKHMIIGAMDYLFGQRLVPHVCPKCSTTRAITEKEIEQAISHLERSFNNAKDFKFPNEVVEVNEEGCADCEYGLVGVLPCHEVLPMSSDVKSLALKGTLDNFNKILLEKRPFTVEEAALELIRQHKTPLSSIYV